MQKYTYYNYTVALFIGLFSFNIWSSCVHASRQELAPFSSCWGNIKIAQARHPKVVKKTVWTVATFTALIAACFTVPRLLKLTNYDGNNPNMPIIYNNGTGVTTAGPFTSTNGSSPMLNGTDITHLAEVVTKALEKGEKEGWGNGTTTENPSTTTKKPSRKPSKKPSKKPYTTTTSTTAKPSTTTAKPDGGVPPVEHPMLLTPDMITYLTKNKFSVERIQGLFNNNLNVNAQDKNGLTILIHAIRNIDLSIDQNQDDFKFILSFSRSNGNRRLDVNLQDNSGNTALTHMLNRIPFAGGEKADRYLDVVKRLVDAGADPCIENRMKNSAQKMVQSRASKGGEYSVLPGIIADLFKPAIKKLHGTEECPAKQSTN